MVDHNNNNNNNNSNEMRKIVVVDEKYCNEKEVELTVHKKSMFSQGDGFTVYDQNGDIIFRCDFGGLIKHHALLMDAFGYPLLTLIPKRPTLHHRLEAFLGETSDNRHPIFSIWKSTMIGWSTMMVEVYTHGTSHTSIGYHIEGSYRDRSCTILRVQPDTSMVHVAEMKRKVEPIRQTVLGKDVFRLTIQPGVDAAFVMGLVLALDTIDGDDVALSSSTS